MGETNIRKLRFAGCSAGGFPEERFQAFHAGSPYPHCPFSARARGRFPNFS